MGKRGGKKGGKGQRGQRSNERQDWQSFPRENERLEKYYNELGIVSEDERAQFWEFMRRDLPNSFRFAGSKGHALAVQRRLVERYIPEIAKIDNFDGEVVEAPYPLPWYPEELAWAMNTSKRVIRRSPPFASFQKFLVSETSVGNISRQEAVSMIPPLLMDIKSNMTVLDLCAAPGSKATQLIEMIHTGEESRIRQLQRKLATQNGRDISPDGAEVDAEHADADGDSDTNWQDDGRSTGLLVANDADYKRSHLLVHQLKRLNSPNFIVTNHDASLYPSLRLKPTSPTPDQPRHAQYLKFDRILADVPCSGDGTLRKNIRVWKDWSPGNALGLHNTQVRILVRALQMLQVGGRVVYSTCSMNPIENEAVVAAAIDRCGGSAQVQLVDCSDKLPHLHRRPGLNQWKVMDRRNRLWSSWDEVSGVQNENPDPELERLSETMFSKPEQPLSLESCMRIYGHLQDTGSFFIAVIEKKTLIKARPENEPKTATESAAPITAMVDEIASKQHTGEEPEGKIQSADAISAPEPAILDESATARQNAIVENDNTLTGVKRGVDGDDDAGESAERTKVEEEAKESKAVAGVKRGVEAENGQPTKRIKVHGETQQSTAGPSTSGSEQNGVAQRHSSQPPQSAAFKKHKGAAQPFEEPFKYLPSDHLELQTVFDFYGISERFPRDRFMVRNVTGEPVKTIYYTTSLSQEILTENEGKGIKFVHGGVKMFVAQDVSRTGTCKWRIQTEGMPLIESWVSEKRVVRLYRQETLRKLLIEMFPRIGGGYWANLDEMGEQIRDIEPGCCVLRIETSDSEDGFRERMVLPLWKSLYSVNLMLPKEDRRAMLLRMFNDDTPLDFTQQSTKPARNTEQEKEEAQDESEREPLQEESFLDVQIPMGGTVD